MKRFLFLLVWLSVWGFIYSDDISVALMEFEIRGNLSLDSVMITESLQTELVKDKHITVVERSELDQVMGEQELEMTGVIDSDQAAEIGAFLGAEKILMGTISHTGEYYVITIKGVDVETGVVDFADQVMSYDRQGVYDVLSTLSDRISRLARGKRVKDFELEEKEDTRNGRSATKTSNGFNFIRNSSLGVNYIFGIAPAFTNCTLTGVEISFRIPTYSLLQFDLDTGFLWGNPTDNSVLSVYRIHPGLYIRLLDKKWFHFGLKPGFSIQWNNVKPMDSGFINRFYPFIQYDVTIGAEASLIIAKKFAIRTGWEFGIPIRYWVSGDAEITDEALKESLGVNVLENENGFMHHLFYLSLEWQF